MLTSSLIPTTPPLASPTVPRRVISLQALRGMPARAYVDGVDWTAPIDRTRLFFCETLTPLYYTPSYATLAPEHRRRYNQLMGMLSNELILRLETGFVRGALGAVARRAAGHEELTDVVRRFGDDEKQHAQTWGRLNELSEPAWYSSGNRRLVRVSPALEYLGKVLSRHPFACPVVFWIQLAQEERSVEISRRCLRMPEGALEPRYAAVYAEHLRDEVKHVHIDCHLIERFYAGQSMAVRRTTARVFRWALANLFLRPARSTVHVIEVLAAEHPELQPTVPRLVRELRDLVRNDDYHRMMYSRQTTPLTFEMFDAFPEFHSMTEVLRAYDPPRAAGAA